MKPIFILLLLAWGTIIASQNQRTSVGAGIGLGSLFGNFPSQTSFGSKLYFETESPVTIVDNLQFQFIYGQKIEKILPGSYNYDHYSYFLGFGAAGIFNQSLGNKYFIEEGIGIIYINDRSFNDIDVWNYGFSINFSLGYQLNNNLSLTMNLDSGLTLNNTNISYFLFHLGIGYYL